MGYSPWGLKELDKTERLTQEHDSNLLASGTEKMYLVTTQFARERHQHGRKVEGLFCFSLFHFTYPITKRSTLSFMKTQMSSLKAYLAQEPEVPFHSFKIKSYSHLLVLLT